VGERLQTARDQRLATARRRTRTFDCGVHRDVSPHAGCRGRNEADSSPLHSLKHGASGATLMSKVGAKGAVQKVTGSVKEAAGKATGNKKLAAEGAADKAFASAKQGAGKVADAAKKAAKKV
jgi:uncharacterized protein YjbJ (UPF0337 family)